MLGIKACATQLFDTTQDFISHRGGRVVLLDYKTTDENREARQVWELLFLVDGVLSQNGGQPFTNDCLRESKV